MLMRLGSCLLVVLVLRTAIAAAAPDVSTCCGTDRASLGAFFRGITLGQTTTPTLSPAANLGAAVSVELEKKGARLEGIAIRINDAALCTVLRDKLVKAWGPPTDNRWASRARDRAV